MEVRTCWTRAYNFKLNSPLAPFAYYLQVSFEAAAGASQQYLKELQMAHDISIIVAFTNDGRVRLSLKGGNLGVEAAHREILQVCVTVSVVISSGYTLY